jgi:hypothetical protein
VNSLVRLVSKTEEYFALYAADLNGSAFLITSSPVIDATNTTRTISISFFKTNRSGLNGHPLTSYVRTAMYRLPLEEVELVSTKCPTCKKPTENEYVTVTPTMYGETFTNDDALNALKLTKRLVLCTECGTLRLIN